MGLDGVGDGRHETKRQSGVVAVGHTQKQEPEKREPLTAVGKNGDQLMRRTLLRIVIGTALTICMTPLVGGAEGPQWRPLFDGRSLGDWKPSAFGSEGEVSVADGVIRIAMGFDLSGITFGGRFPRHNYEISLEARRVDGHDFFCGLTFPVGDDPCSLIVGGWGGGVVGLSSIDGRDAAHNDTTQWKDFEKGRWYAVAVRVTPERIVCLLDDEEIIDQPLDGKRVSIRDEVAASKPLGIATYATTAEVRKIRVRDLPSGADAGRGTGAVPGGAKVE